MSISVKTYNMTKPRQDIIDLVIYFLELILKAARAGSLALVGGDFLNHLFELVEQNHLLLEKFFVLKYNNNHIFNYIIIIKNFQPQSPIALLKHLSSRSDGLNNATQYRYYLDYEKTILIEKPF